MALINQINAATEAHWLTVKPVDILNTASALLWKLLGNALVNNNWEVKAHETVDGGTMMKVPLKYQNSNYGGYGATTVINQSKKDLLDAARFGWGGAYGSNTLNLDDFTQNTGPAAVVHLANTYLEDIKVSLKIGMAKYVIQTAAASAAADDDPGAQAKDFINGLGDLFNTTTSTEYGAISTDIMAAWKANVVTTALEISFETMQAVMRTPNRGNIPAMLPNFIVTTPLLVDAYELSLQPQQRFVANEAMLKAGWQHCTHKGIPIVGDVNYSTGTLDALNLNVLQLRAHRDFNFTTPKWIDKEVLGMPDLMTASSRWRGNLTCSDRALQVRYTALSAPA